MPRPKDEDKGAAALREQLLGLLQGDNALTDLL